MAYKYILTENRDGVLVVTMHDPGTRNSLSNEMAAEFLQELDRFEEDPDGRVLLVTGTEPSFCSGANVRRMDRDVQGRQEEPQEVKTPLPWGRMEARMARRGPVETSLGPQVPLRIHELQKPSIAAVNGYAMGVGMGVALGCDIRLASEKAVFSEAFSRMGLIPGDGSCWQLPRLIGPSNTLLLQYTGDRVDAAEALRLGLVSRVHAQEELMPAAMELAGRLAAGPTQTLSLIKYLVHASMDISLKESLDLGFVAQEIVRQTDDHKEAVRAFVEKRPPKFKGR